MSIRPDLQDIYHLSTQLEQDREQPIAVLRQRDHGIASRQPEGKSKKDTDLLLAWLDALQGQAESQAIGATVLIVASRLLVFLLGFLWMATFLLGSIRSLVNVLLLLAVFVALQCLMSVVSLLALLRTISGYTPARMPANPTYWIVRRSLPDGRYLREAGGVLQLLFLRYGQEWGALFTVGALTAFVLVPGLADFSFVWGSTFPVGDEFMQALVSALAAPWSDWLPIATVPADVISNSRFHPALLSLDRAGIESMRGWWGFLFMCMLVYALLPRLLLWLCARYFYPRLLRRSFMQYPGTDLVLRRMRRPLVQTQGVLDDSEAPGSEGVDLDGGLEIEVDARLLLLNCNDALDGKSPAAFEELLAVGRDNMVIIGRGELAGDRERLRVRIQGSYDHLLVAVKSWEPPMAELADLLQELAMIPRCTIYLCPLPGRLVPSRKIEDWRGFARKLPFASVDVRLLNKVGT
ncbi:MAG: DUF2868 domain-containing protein [Parahaliea sp.]